MSNVEITYGTDTISISLNPEDNADLRPAPPVKNNNVYNLNKLANSFIIGAMFFCISSMTTTVTNQSNLSQNKIITQSISKFGNTSARIAILDLSQKQLLNYPVSNSSQSDIMVVEGRSKEDTLMLYEKLIQQRDRFEHYGIKTGVILAILLVCSSLISSYVPWSATLPSALLALSLSGSIKLKRRLRGDN